jgi:hypothetical protein
MWSAATLDDGRAPFYHYGEGWERNRLRDQDVIEYDGSWQGFHGAMARYPALQLAVVVLGNRDDWRAQRLLHDIAGRFDPHARPYRVGTARGGCSGRLRAWLEREIGSTSAMGRELAAIGPIHATHTAERVSKTSDAWVIKVEANSMDDWMTVQCEGDQPEVQSVYREY